MRAATVVQVLQDLFYVLKLYHNYDKTCNLLLASCMLQEKPITSTCSYGRVLATSSEHWLHVINNIILAVTELLYMDVWAAKVIIRCISFINITVSINRFFLKSTSIFLSGALYTDFYLMKQHVWPARIFVIECLPSQCCVGDICLCAVFSKHDSLSPDSVINR